MECVLPLHAYDSENRATIAVNGYNFHFARRRAPRPAPRIVLLPSRGNVKWLSANKDHAENLLAVFR
jgi:hypothetical protein